LGAEDGSNGLAAATAVRGVEVEDGDTADDFRFLSAGVAVLGIREDPRFWPVEGSCDFVAI
jgi:hypothetical protein